GDDAAAELRRRHGTLRGVGERTDRLVERCELGAAALALVEVLFEGPAVVRVERVERVGGGQIVEVVVRHLVPFVNIRTPGQIGSTYSRGGFWTLCSVAYSFVRRLISSGFP